VHLRPIEAAALRTNVKVSRSQFVDVRGLSYHVRTWGEAGAPKLFLLHGWMDVSASFQFLVDALAGQWHVLAPDWRGFGPSETPQDGYWFPDYVADLDALRRGSKAAQEGVDRERDRAEDRDLAERVEGTKVDEHDVDDVGASSLRQRAAEEER